MSFTTINASDNEADVVIKALSKADTFDYLVLLDPDLIIMKAKVLVYREDYGGEIGSKRWLKQFNDLSTKDSVVYSKDIKGISGATISSKAVARIINDKILDAKTEYYLLSGK